MLLLVPFMLSRIFSSCRKFLSSCYEFHASHDKFHASCMLKVPCKLTNNCKNTFRGSSNFTWLLDICCWWWVEGTEEGYIQKARQTAVVAFFVWKNGCPLLLLKLGNTQVDNGGPGKLYDYDLIKFVILLPIIILSKSSAVESWASSGLWFESSGNK